MEPKKLKARVKDELRVMGLLTLYLFALFGTLTLYKRLILAEQGIHFGDYGASLIDALVVAKAILIGAGFRIGSRFNDRPLIIPALYKTFCFSLLVLGVELAERLIRGWWAGETTAAVFAACAGPEKWAILARVTMLFFALIPFFAFWETNRVLGGDVLRKLFFESRTSPDGSAQR